METHPPLIDERPAYRRITSSNEEGETLAVTLYIRYTPTFLQLPARRHSRVNRQHDGIGTFADTDRAPSRRNLRKVSATDAHRTAWLLSVLGELVCHRHQQPAVRAGHGIKRLNQPFNRLA